MSPIVFCCWNDSCRLLKYSLFSALWAANARPLCAYKLISRGIDKFISISIYMTKLRDGLQHLSVTSSSGVPSLILSVVYVVPQRGRTSSEESCFNSPQLHCGQPALLPGLHVAFQPAWVYTEAPVRQDSFLRGVWQASEQRPSAPDQHCKDGRAQPQPHGCHSCHDPCPEQGWLNCLVCPVPEKRLHQGEAIKDGSRTQARTQASENGARAHLQIGVYSSCKYLSLLWC